MIPALTLAAALLFAHPQPCSPHLMAAIAHVESRGHVFAVSPTGCRGLHQVQPRYSLAPAWALHVPAVSRWEGCRILRRWQARCGGDMDCALRCYSHGRAGMRGVGQWYADRVMGGVR